MPYLNVVPTSFRLCVIAGKEQDFNVRLLGTLKPASREKVTLSTEENFEDLEGNLSIFERRSKEQNGDEVVGSITYSEEFVALDMHHAACYTVYIYLPKARFEILLAAVSRGQRPSEIMIDIQEGGMQYDGNWLGSGKVWDNKASPELRIKTVSVFTPLIGADPYDRSNKRVPEDGMPPSKAQIADVKQGLTELRQSFRWLLLLVGLILGLLVYRLG